MHLLEHVSIKSAFEKNTWDSIYSYNQLKSNIVGKFIDFKLKSQCSLTSTL